MLNVYEKPLRDYMWENNLTQQKLGELLGISKTKVCDIVNGYRQPTPELIEIIAEKTGIVFPEIPEPLETVTVEQAAFELGMSPEMLRNCLKEKEFDYQFGITCKGVNRYIIWRDKLDRFKKM